MSKISKENQQFRSFDVIAIMVLLGLGIFFYSYPFNQHSDQANVKNSKDKAEILSYQIAQIYRDKILESNQGRGPASEKQSFKSEGVIGEDALGRPFKYRVQEEGSNKLRVIITNKPDFDSNVTDSDAVQVELVVPIDVKEST